MKNLWLVLALLVGSGSIVLANGGAWQGGVPGAGTASASNKDQKTDVTIENETLKIITVVQLRIHSATWCSTARRPSHRGIVARCSRSI
jgi:outer membrane lipoprotein SlyB